MNERKVTMEMKVGNKRFGTLWALVVLTIKLHLINAMSARRNGAGWKLSKSTSYPHTY